MLRVTTTHATTTHATTIRAATIAHTTIRDLIWSRTDTAITGINGLNPGNGVFFIMEEKI